ncbi:hypothetical protein GGTG_08004 [Gaeumannomyces tritici R3-111a-1]|uniref:Uncharacterized protein n=1 Tax=Gaeumannomyces tritici (strain R3-111a-1) TaxID=644352 RepID=J3P3B6_GAET3|nr:hypothetical protein GGTG_08004 [Gaeumannomyces tritici R3-111a-1]EJT74158.1 hypothetical protein GGTG_08004 [Gaeumannomyces tritici R3-111a-1]
MKGPITAAVLWLHLHFSQSAWAYGPRGAAERAFYYSVYLMEEIRGFQGLGGEYRLASGCRATPTKTAAGTAVLDTKPDMSKIQWPTGKGPAKTGSVTTVAAIYKHVMKAKISGAHITNGGAWGYQGNTGQLGAQLANDWEDAIAKGVITPENKDHIKADGTFAKLTDGARAASAAVVDLRIIDSWRHQKAGFADGVGVEPALIPREEGRRVWTFDRPRDPRWPVDSNPAELWNSEKVAKAFNYQAKDLMMIDGRATPVVIQIELGVTAQEAVKIFKDRWETIKKSQRIWHMKRRYRAQEGRDMHDHRPTS